MKNQYKVSIILVFSLFCLCNVSQAVDLIDDSDGDGWSNTNEILAVTDPNNGTDFPVPKINVSSTYSGTNLDYNSYPLFVYAYGDSSSPNMGGMYDAILKPASSKVIESVTFDSDGNASLSSTKIAPRTLKIIGHRHDSCDVPKDSSSGSLWCYYSGSPSVNYNTGAISGGPSGVSMKVSYEKTDAIESHVRSGWNRFFGFIDLNGNFTYDINEPAGLSAARPTLVDWDAVDTDVALTDFLVGYPRISWTASTSNTLYNCNNYYTVTISAWGGTAVTVPIQKPRTFFHEGDLINAGIDGLDFGAATEVAFDYTVTDGDNLISSGAFCYDLGTTGNRKAMQALYPAQGEIVYGSIVEFKWEMDYRTEGVRISIYERGTNGVNIGSPYYDDLINPPVQHGRTTDDSYYYSAVPQNVDGKAYFTLPPGSYNYTIKEYVRTTSGELTKQYVREWFQVAPNDDATGVYAINGNISYLGKVGITSTNPIVVTAYELSASAKSCKGLSGVIVSRSVIASTNGLYTLNGILQGRYSVRAFIDSNNDRVFDYWESYGIADNELHEPFAVPLTNNVDIIIVDSDSDNDLLPDAWEYKQFGSLTATSGYDMYDATTYWWEFYNSL